MLTVIVVGIACFLLGVFAGAAAMRSSQLDSVEGWYDE